jgi:hypothetical protein
MGDPARITLAEYATLRDEMLGRLQSQSQAFAHVLAVGAVAFGLAGTIVSSTTLLAVSPDVKVMAALMVPVAVVPVSMIFFDNEIMIFVIGGYIWEMLRPRLREAEAGSLPGDALLVIGRKLNVVHFGVSATRWIAFLVPVLMAYVYALQHLGDLSKPWKAYAISLLMVNSLLLVLLFAAIGAVTYLQLKWRWAELVTGPGDE